LSVRGACAQQQTSHTLLLLSLAKTDIEGRTGMAKPISLKLRAHLVELRTVVASLAL